MSIVIADYRRDAPKGKALSRAFQSALSCEQAAHNAAFCTTGIWVPLPVSRSACRAGGGWHQAECWREFRSGTSGTNHLFANSTRSPRVHRHESRKLDYLGGFAGDALGHHLDWLRYLEDDRRRSDFRERLRRNGCWCGAITINWLRADRTAILQ